MFQTSVWNGGLCVMPGTHKNGGPRAAAVDRYTKFYSFSLRNGVKRNGITTISVKPTILSPHSSDSEVTNNAAIIKTEPGGIAVNHNG